MLSWRPELHFRASLSSSAFHRPLPLVWQGRGRLWWPLLYNERLSDHIGYLITKLCYVSLEARTLEMQRIDPVSDLTFFEHQRLMEKGARQFSLQFRVRAVRQGGGGIITRELPGFPETGAWHPSCPEWAANISVIVFVLILFSCYPPSFAFVMDADTHTYVHVWNTHITLREMYFWSWTWNNHIPCVMQVTA